MVSLAKGEKITMDEQEGVPGRTCRLRDSELRREQGAPRGCEQDRDVATFTLQEEPRMEGRVAENVGAR